MSELNEEIFGGDEEIVVTRRGLREQRARRRRQRGRGRRLSILFIAIALVAGGGLAAATVLRPVVDKIASAFTAKETDFPGPGEGSVKVTIKPGQNGEDIATTLKEAGVVKTRTAYLNASRTDPESAAKIQPGTYTLKKGMRGIDAFAIIIDPANATNPVVTLPEGLWASEIFDRLSRATGVQRADYDAAAKSGQIGLPPQAGGKVEGWLFPSTYQLNDDSTAVQQLSELVTRMKEELAKAKVTPDRYQHVLTVASIVEAEAGPSEDQGKIARVIENRLNDPAGPTVGFLQMDSTRNYALRKRGILGKGDVEKSAKSPYDTYAHKGLPPGPINNPGGKAIAAAADPPEGPWFYFVTVNFDTGETLFASTIAEHEANVAKMKAWCQANHPKCEAK